MPQPQTTKKAHRVNQEITAPEIRLVVENGTPPEIITRDAALDLAREKELDLVEIAPQATPPVCRLMNYGKFLYMQSKQQRLHKAKQKKVELKTLRFSLKIEKHDLETKVKKALAFLDQGHKVKFDLTLRGREKAFVPQAFDKMNHFLTHFPDDIKHDQPLKKTPQGLTVTLSKLKK
jgi:translation initiation factor IF-3